MVATADIWSLALDRITIDPEELLLAIEAEVQNPIQDFRTRVLLRDSFRALVAHMGEDRLRSRLSSRALAKVDEISSENLGERGFASLEKRFVESTRAVTIMQMLRELGSAIHRPTSLNIGGSSALILLELLHRRTDDIDAVNEIPETIRTNYELLEGLIRRYGLRLAHFQSHYLPDAWDSRLKSFGAFDQLQVFLVDPVDITLGKLFSQREKDLDDLRALIPLIGKGALAQRLVEAGASLMSEAKNRANAQRNWFILFGEDLPA